MTGFERRSSACRTTAAACCLLLGTAGTHGGTTGTAGTAVTRLTPPPTEQPGWDAAGSSLAIDGDTMVVGAPYADYAEVDTGAVVVYRRVAGSWQHAATLVPGDAMRDERAGTAVAVSGSNVVVGCPYDGWFGYPYTEEDAGRVLVFHDTSTAGDWSSFSQVQLTAPELAGNLIGAAVAMEGGTIVVGAPSSGRCSGPDFLVPGSITIYQDTSSAGDWSGYTTAFLEPPEDILQLGRSLAIEGRTIVVGALNEDGESGAVVVLRDTSVAADWSTYSLNQLVPATPSGGVFGVSVDISGSTIVVGAQDEGCRSISGAVHFFTSTGVSDDWSSYIESMRDASDSYDCDCFGRAVAIQGFTALVGAPSRQYQPEDPGAVYRYSCPYPGGWDAAVESKLVMVDAVNGQRLGSAVGLDGTTIAAGAPGDDLAGEDAGAVFVFYGGADSRRLDLGGIADDGPQDFGAAVATDGTTLVIGAPNDDQGEVSNAGSLLVYRRGEDGWVLLRKLRGPDGIRSPGFGHSVALSGSTIVAGATDPRSTQLGSAFVLHDTSPDGDWRSHSLQELEPADGRSRRYARAVAISGKTIVVSDEELNAAYLFLDTGAGDWSSCLERTLTVPDTSRLGHAVAIDGDTVAVSKFAGEGSVFLFQDTSSAGDWSSYRHIALRGTDMGGSPYFGVSVALSGDTVVIGDYGDELSGFRSGAAHLIRDTSGSGDWSSYTRIRLAAPDAREWDQSGTAVAVHEGSVVVGRATSVNGISCAWKGEAREGKAGKEDLFRNNMGSAHLFQDASISGNWSSIAYRKLLPPEAVPFDQVGSAVAVFGSLVVIGAPHADGETGAAYLYEIPSPSLFSNGFESGNTAAWSVTVSPVSPRPVGGRRGPS